MGPYEPKMKTQSWLEQKTLPEVPKKKTLQEIKNKLREDRFSVLRVRLMDACSILCLLAVDLTEVKERKKLVHIQKTIRILENILELKENN